MHYRLATGTEPHQAEALLSDVAFTEQGARQMTIWDVSRYALGICAASAMLSGCGALRQAQDDTQPPLGAPGAMPQSRSVATHATHGKSWMLLEAKGTDLLYISGGCGGVCVVTYPSGKLVGSLAVKDSLLCSDKAGNVFVTSGQTESVGYIYEYQHGGTEPISTLSDTGFPNGCSVDPTTGNLAVANYFAPRSQYGHGNVAIYTNAEGTPTYYEDPSIYWYGFCGYDGGGNLLVNGNSETYTTPFAMLRKGSSTFTDITMNKNVGDAQIQWHGRDFAIGYINGVVYEVSVSGSKGTVVGQTPLNAPGLRDIAPEFSIDGHTLVVPYRRQGAHADYIGMWRYPMGGNPQKILKRIDGMKLPDYMYGVTISVAPSRARARR